MISHDIGFVAPLQVLLWRRKRSLWCQLVVPVRVILHFSVRCIFGDCSDHTFVCVLKEGGNPHQTSSFGLRTGLQPDSVCGTYWTYTFLSFHSVFIWLFQSELEQSTNLLLLTLKSTEDYRDLFLEFSNCGFLFWRSCHNREIEAWPVQGKMSHELRKYIDICGKKD